MNALDKLTGAFWRWLDWVAEAAVELLSQLNKARTLRLVETQPGQFAIVDPEKKAGGSLPRPGLHIEHGKIASASSVQEAVRGGNIEISLHPDRFVFKPLELPSRASEFLDGVVRAQIDRLTPWKAEEAAFGFSAPADAGSGRIMITVAATAKAMVLPLLQAFSTLGARSVLLCTKPPEAAPDGAPITVMQEAAGGMLGVRRVRRILVAVLALALIGAAGATVAASFVNDGLRSRQDEIARRIVQVRKAAMAARNDTGDPKLVAERALAKRKNDSPSDVIALEILSQIFPDSTYVTELRIEADKLRVTGFTHDAPQLIRLIEQTKHFKHATFFAPITRSSSSSGDRFNIEAMMEPNFALTP